MIALSHPTLTLALSLLASVPPVALAGENLPARWIDAARPATRPAGAPRYSDVCLSSRWLHPLNDNDPHNTLETIEAFGATRLEWAYISDKAFIERIKARGLTFAPAVSTMTFVGRLSSERTLGRVVDRKGSPVTAPWMRMWRESGWGCVNSPDYRQSYLSRLEQFADLGADAIQADDPGCNWTATRWGACFCPHCMAGFASYLGETLTAEQREQAGIEDPRSFDYAAHLDRQDAPTGDDFGAWDGGPLKQHFIEFQRLSVESFYRDTWKELARHAGRRIPMTCNNGSRWTFPYHLFDYGVSELSHHDAHPDRIRTKLTQAAALGKAQVFTLVSDSVPLNRRMIAASYANGGHLLVPWDVYLRSTPQGSDRYYGKPEEYADLYRFVRQNAEFFDGYEDAAAFGPHVEDARHAAAPPVSVDARAGIYVFARAVPGRPEAPVVMHLMHMDDRPQTFSTTWRTHALFGDRPVRVEWREPGREPRRLEVRHAPGKATVDIEQLELWGLLIVKPATNGA